MKIIFYENPKGKELWFTGRKAELTTGKVFFSNSKQWVEDFNNKDIEELKSLVRIWLPPIESLSPRNEDNIILYIPFGMKEMFSLILEKLGFKTKRGEVSSVPISQELGLGQGETRTIFCDNMKINEVTIVMSIKEELKEVFNNIVKEDNEIDAVFVYHPKDGLVGVCSDPSPDKNRQVDIGVFERVLGDVATSKIAVKDRAGLGSLEHTTHHFSEGIVNVTIMQDGFKELFLLCFVSSTPEGLGELLRYRRGNMTDLNTRLRAIGL